MNTKSISTETIKKIQDFFHDYPTQTFYNDEIILTQDDTPKGVYYLHSGYVMQYGTSREGQDVLLHIYSPGAYFPMTWAIGEIPNTYFFKAVNDVTCRIASKKEFNSFLESNPDVLLELTQRLLLGMSGLLDRVLLNSFSSGYVRVASTILFLSKHFGKRNKSSVVLTTSFTHLEIASFAGLARETTSNELKKLKEKDLIRFDKRRITIPSTSRLQKEITS